MNEIILPAKKGELKARLNFQSSRDLVVHKGNQETWEEALKLYEETTGKRLSRSCDSCLRTVWQWLNE